jgi:serine/threonine-protein kinase RsbW
MIQSMSDHVASDAVVDVQLSLPATSSHLRLARVMAAGVASLGQLDYDSVEDLRIAVDELCTLLVQGAAPGGRIDLVYRLAGDHLEVEARTASRAGAVAPAVPSLTGQILSAVADGYELWAADGHIGFTLRSARWAAAT